MTLVSFIEHFQFKALNKGIRLKECIRKHLKLMNVRVRCAAVDSIYAMFMNEQVKVC